MNNRTTELESLSKLKMAGRLRFWRGTIEIPEDELHAICDEIQAEHDRAVAALNKAAGNWAKADALLRERTSGTLTAEQVREAIRKYAEDDSCYIFEVYGEMCGPIADELNARAERTCELTDNGTWGYPYVCSACGASFDADVNNGDFNYCPNYGAKVRDE